MPDGWNKARIVNRLTAVRGYRNYLELCAATTGQRCEEIDRQLLSCRRLSYLTLDQHIDGLGTDYRSADRGIAPCLAQMAADGFRFDIALVDPWHEYETSWRDLNEAFRLLPEGGSLVVHDCLPTRAEISRAALPAGPNGMVRRDLSGLCRFRARPQRSRLLHGRLRLWLRGDPQETAYGPARPARADRRVHGAAAAAEAAPPPMARGETGRRRGGLRLLPGAPRALAQPDLGGGVSK